MEEEVRDCKVCNHPVFDGYSKDVHDKCRKELCPDCGGDGHSQNSCNQPYQDCPTCKGTGINPVSRVTIGMPKKRLNLVVPPEYYENPPNEKLEKDIKRTLDLLLMTQRASTIVVDTTSFTQSILTLLQGRLTAAQNDSYEAGYQKGQEHSIGTDTKLRAEGAKETVEWIYKTFNEQSTLGQMMATNTWQAEFKEGE